VRRLFIMRKDLHMSTGKLLAQTCHCAEAYWTRKIHAGVELVVDGKVIVNIEILKDEYFQYVSGTFTKTVCEARSKTHLLKAKTMADDMGLVEDVDYGMIYDKCLTELEPEEQDGTTLTGIWFKPLPDDQAHAISKKYQLYK